MGYAPECKFCSTWNLALSFEGDVIVTTNGTGRLGLGVRRPVLRFDPRFAPPLRCRERVTDSWHGRKSPRRRPRPKVIQPWDRPARPIRPPRGTVQPAPRGPSTACRTYALCRTFRPPFRSARCARKPPWNSPGYVPNSDRTDGPIRTRFEPRPAPLRTRISQVADQTTDVKLSKHVQRATPPVPVVCLSFVGLRVAFSIAPVRFRPRPASAVRNLHFSAKTLVTPCPNATYIVGDGCARPGYCSEGPMVVAGRAVETVLEHPTGLFQGRLNCHGPDRDGVGRDR